MIDSVADLLAKRKNREPAEFQVIRNFIKKEYNEQVDLSILNNQILIGVNNSAFAGDLQLRLHEIESLMPKQTKLRIVLN